MIYKNKRTKSVETMTFEESREWVIEQACDRYVSGEISVERLEADVDALLHDKTPVDAAGWPLYYDPRLLNYVNNY